MHLKDGVGGGACANNPCLPTFLAIFRSAADMVTRPSEVAGRTRLNGRSTDDQPSEEHQQWALLVTCREATPVPLGLEFKRAFARGARLHSCGEDQRPWPTLDAINLIAVHFASSPKRRTTASDHDHAVHEHVHERSLAARQPGPSPDREGRYMHDGLKVARSPAVGRRERSKAR